ncbi:MAG: hypothetical protein V2I62_02470 [Bacteroidales bacterium]|jgi:hypothetical protein|nr:hypothetical protein [Bacteroidales bacterium]
MILVKKTHSTFFFIAFFVLSIFSSCQLNQKEKQISGSDFNVGSTEAFKQVVAFSDSIVFEHTQGIADIHEAYMRYLDSVCPLILKNGDFGRSGIDADTREKLFDSLNKEELEEIFMVGDTIEYFSMDVKRKVKKYFPYHVEMNPKGEFADLLAQLSDNNPLVKNYYTEMMARGDLSPSCYGMVLRNYDQLDFSNAGHRLLYAVTILRANEKIKDRFVH